MRRVLRIVKKKWQFLLFIFCISTANKLAAQADQPDINFGSVKPTDFNHARDSISNNAEAVFLFDVGSVYFHEPDDSHFEMVRHRHQRILILSSNAFDLATFALSLDKGESEETLDNLDAAVYNLEDGKVAAQAIDKASVFTEKNKKEKRIKFTLPNVSVGSIVEFSYTVRRPGIDLPGWNFQGQYPRLWSRYEVVIPYFFNFAVLKTGTLSFMVDSTSTFHTNYAYQYAPPNVDNTLQHTWVVKNMPGVASEPFINTLNNYVAQIDFQISAYRNASGSYNAVSRSWFSVCQNMMNNTAFGFADDKEKKMLGALVKTVCRDDTSKLEKAKHIFSYVRDNFTCLYHYGKWRTRDIKETVQSKKGTVGDLNLLLYSMLGEAGLNANPVIISTTNNGKINYDYPTLPKYNYVVCQLVVDKKQYLLDASCRYLPFGALNDYCYNGYARVINVPSSQGISLSPNSLTDSIVTNIIIRPADNKAMITTTLSRQPSIEAKAYKESEADNKDADVLKEILYSETPVNDVRASGFSKADSDVVFNYEVLSEPFEADVVYISPLQSLQMKSNPFAAATRKFDVEMPFCRNDVFHVSMNIPQDYEVEELPKPVEIKADTILSRFTYAVSIENNMLHIDVQTKLGKAVFQPEEYPFLRKFYSDALAKEAEQIVFRKKK